MPKKQKKQKHTKPRPKQKHTKTTKKAPAKRASKKKAPKKCRTSNKKITKKKTLKKTSKKVVAKKTKKGKVVKKVRKGRPPGSKNKKTIERETEEKRLRGLGIEPIKPKRGRPRGVKNKQYVVPEEYLKPNEKVETKDHALNEGDDYDYSTVTTSYFLGYCPKCDNMITTAELQDARKKKGKYKCPGCGRRGTGNNLCTESASARMNGENDNDKSDKPKGNISRAPKVSSASSATVINQHDKDIQDLLEKNIGVNGFLDTP